MASGFFAALRPALASPAGKSSDSSNSGRKRRKRRRRNRSFSRTNNS